MVKYPRVDLTSESTGFAFHSTIYLSSYFRNLLAQKGAFSEFLIQYLQEQNEEDLAEIQDVIEDEDLKFIIQRQTSVISQSVDRT